MRLGISGKFWAECLNAQWFTSLDDARAKCEAWRRDYNEVRPHSTIGNKLPIKLVNLSGTVAQPDTEMFWRRFNQLLQRWGGQLKQNEHTAY